MYEYETENGVFRHNKQLSERKSSGVIGAMVVVVAYVIKALALVQKISGFEMITSKEHWHLFFNELLKEFLSDKKLQERVAARLSVKLAKTDKTDKSNARKQELEIYKQAVLLKLQSKLDAGAVVDKKELVSVLRNVKEWNLSEEEIFQIVPEKHSAYEQKLKVDFDF